MPMCLELEMNLNHLSWKYSSLYLSLLRAPSGIIHPSMHTCIHLLATCAWLCSNYAHLRPSPRSSKVLCGLHPGPTSGLHCYSGSVMKLWALNCWWSLFKEYHSCDSCTVFLSHPCIQMNGAHLSAHCKINLINVQVTHILFFFK